VNGELPEISEEHIGVAEEKNYELMEASTGKKFRDRLNVPLRIPTRKTFLPSRKTRCWKTKTTRKRS
jgi:hypothetical protein